MPVLTAELVRNANACIGLIALVWILFDSLSKKADVISLKEKLDLRRRQLIGEIVGEIAKSVADFLERPGNYETEGDLLTPPTPTFGDNFRDALADVIRINEERLALLRTVKRLPKVIHTLNAAQFWLILSVSIVGFSSAGILIIADTSLVERWALIGILACVVLATVIVTILRQAKVQYAEEQILNSDPQA